MIGCSLTASSDEGKGRRERQRDDEERKKFFSRFAFFYYKITSRVSFITSGYVVYAVHDNDVKSAQKISRGCHRLCVLYRMNQSSRLSTTHVS
jgi:hypothetical protein